MAPQQPGHDDGGDQEVGAPVIRIEDVHHVIRPDEQRLDGLLAEQAEGLLGGHDGKGVAGRGPAGLHHAVDGIHRHMDELQL
ncbi:MAG: hypothetical protein WAK82_18330 [Streptosporangiaceae bacterium]